MKDEKTFIKKTIHFNHNLKKNFRNKNLISKIKPQIRIRPETNEKKNELKQILDFTISHFTIKCSFLCNQIEQMKKEFIEQLEFIKEKEKENKIFEITKEPKKIKDSEEIKELKDFKLLGQKRESENHTKFAFDNLVRKIKSKLVSAILIILNKSLQKEEKTEIKTPLKETKKQKKGDIKSECFLKPEQSIMLDTKVKYNLDLLKMTLREIFSKNVSEKVKNYSKEHQLDYNKNFIEKIKDDERKEKTNAILDMTFLQCMEHYRGSKRYDVLSGLEIEYEKDIEQMSDDVEYMENFIEHLKYFEVLYANKKSRNSKKKKMNKEEN